MPQDNNGSMSHFGNNNSSTDYLIRAQKAKECGNSVLALYLYLAAYEESIKGENPSQTQAVESLKRAWVLACQHKERALAEYIFECLEPYLNESEIAACADQLQDLALDKLEEFGFSRDEMQQMAEMITEDILGEQEGNIKINHILTAKIPSKSAGSIIGGIGKIGEGAKDEKSSSDERVTNSDSLTKQVDGALKRIEEHLDYEAISGYARAIQDMRELGIGLKNSSEYQELTTLLNSMHGINKKPILDTIVLSSDNREDANRFMLATLGELDLPTVHMCMEENLSGMPLLCVSARDINATKTNSLRDLLAGPGVLVLEDLDTWISPVSPNLEDSNSAFMMVQLTRGAREAVSLIEEAVANPDIYVIATVADINDIEGFFFDLIGRITEVEIEPPSPEERVEIWNNLAIDHPSLRGINKAELVRLSAGMSRFDICMAVREAIEAAYKQGLSKRAYVEVTKENLFDKLAAYQPLESKEYKELEDAVVASFMSDISRDFDNFAL